MAISYPQITLSPKKGAFRDLLTRAQEQMKEEGLTVFGEGYANVVTDKNIFDSYRDIMLEGCDANEASDMETLIDNVRWETLNESASGITPISSLSVPAIRTLWPKMALKNAIPTEVVKGPKFSLAYMIPYLRANGKKYKLPRGIINNDEVAGTTSDMGQALYKGVIELAKTQTVTIPGSTPTVDGAGRGFNLLGTLHNTVAVGTPTIDTIDPDFSIVKLQVKFATKEGGVVAYGTEGGANQTREFDAYIQCELRGSISYDLERTVIIEDVSYLIKDSIYGKVDFVNGVLKLASSEGYVTGVKVRGRLSFENNERTESVVFEVGTRDVTIGTGIHIDAPLPNEFLSDVMTMYTIDGVAKMVDILTQVVALRLDTEMRGYITDGFSRQTSNAGGMELFHGFFNCRPDERFNGTPKDWREQIKITIDFLANTLKQRNYFSGGKFIIIGNPVDCALIPNISWSFTGSSTERSGIEVDYEVGAVSGSQRYEVVSSQLVAPGAMFIIYVSSQDEQMTYKYYPYSFLVSKDMKNEKQSLIPNITMSKRHKLEYFNDAMIKLTIANNNGMTSWDHLQNDSTVISGAPAAINVQAQINNVPKPQV